MAYTICWMKFPRPLAVEQVLPFSDRSILRLPKGTSSVDYLIFVDGPPLPASVYVRIDEDDGKGEQGIGTQDLAANMVSELETLVRVLGGNIEKKETDCGESQSDNAGKRMNYGA
jgi:hypothetical protein